MGNYFNHYARAAQGYFGRRDFLKRWWRIYPKDAYSPPPHHATLRRLLLRDPYLLRTSPLMLSVEALPKPAYGSPTGFEVPVATALVRADPAAERGVAYLSLLGVVNDREALVRLLEFAAETLLPLGYRKLIAPVGLCPHLSKGVLESHWNRLPPLHTPYSPPYLGELCYSVMRPVSTYRLYKFEVPQERLAGERLKPLELQRLTDDLLPLLQAALHDPPHFFPPAAEEAALFLKLLEPTPLELYGLSINGQVVGMIALQADTALTLKRLEGGRVPFGGWRLERALQRPTPAGRLLLLSVLPDYRQQGLGERLLEAALAKAQARGWETLTIGTAGETAGTWLRKRGATAVQRYGLYSYSL